MAQNTIAVIADCDDTLAPDTTGQLLSLFGLEPTDVFREAAELVKSGWEPTIAYMHQMIILAEGDGPLADLTLDKMQAVGRNLQFYEGVPAIFSDLKEEL